MRVVVTGGAGFVGSHLVDALLAAGHEVHVLDDLSTGRAEHLPPGAGFHQLDVTSAAAGALVRELRPGALLHQAAQASVARSLADPEADLRANALGSLVMIAAAAEIGAYFLLASSAAVYGTPDALPIPETAPLRPASPYAASKIAAEHYLAAFAAQRGLAGAALRYANVYGSRQRSDGEGGVVAIFAAALAAGTAPAIQGDGRQTRDFIHVADVARAGLAALEQRLTGVFNVATGRETEIGAIYGLLGQVAGTRLPAGSAPARPADLRRSALDAGALQRATGFKAAVGLREGLEETFRWAAGAAAGAPGRA